MTQRDLPTVDFLGLNLLCATTPEFLAWITDAAKSKERVVRVGYLNAAQVNLAFEDGASADRFRRMSCLYADGQAVVWASRRRGEGAPERINAGDFTDAFFGQCARQQIGVALIGGRPGDADRFADRFRARIEGVSIVFTHHGYFSARDEPEVRAGLEAADPDIVLIGMGSPRQECVALEWSNTGRPRVWWCVGALFEYASGRRARAPRWVRRAGMEWFVRLALEPHRMWKRYLIGNPKFIRRVWRGRPVPHSESGESVPSD